MKYKLVSKQVKNQSKSTEKATTIKKSQAKMKSILNGNVLNKQTLRENIRRFEGAIQHMYLDSVGKVTIGVGHMLPNSASAQKLTLVDRKGNLATPQKIKNDYENVAKQKPNKLAKSYKKFTKLDLPEAKINEQLNQHIEHFSAELSSLYTEFDSYPNEVKYALFDMIFNLGKTNLREKFPTFNKAIIARDWLHAAEESRRSKPVPDARNNYVKALLIKAAKKMKKESYL